MSEKNPKNEILEFTHFSEAGSVTERESGLEEEAQLLRERAKQELKKIEVRHDTYLRAGVYDLATVSQSESLITQGQMALAVFVAKTKEIVKEKYQEHTENRAIQKLKSTFEKFTEQLSKHNEIEARIKNESSTSKIEKLDKRLGEFNTKLPGKLLPYLEEYKKAEKNNPKKWHLVETKIRTMLDHAIASSIKNKDVDTALKLWRYYPASASETSGPSNSIITAVMQEVEAKGDAISAHLLKRLKDFPDLLLTQAASLSRANHERDIDSNNTEAIFRHLKHLRNSDLYKGVDHSFPVASLKIADEVNSGEIGKSSIDSETRKQLFAAKNYSNRERILEHIDLFQGDVDTLSPKERKEFLENMTLDTTYNYGNDYVGLTALLAHCQISQMEYSSLFNKFNSRKNWRFTQETFTETVEKETPLALITNASLFGIDAEAQNALIKKVSEEKDFYKKMRIFEQLLSHREKYPDVNFQETEKLFTQMLEEAMTDTSVNQYLYLDKKQFSQIVSTPELKEKIDSLLSNNLVAQLDCIRSGYGKKLFSKERIDKIKMDVLDHAGVKEMQFVFSNSHELGFSQEEITRMVHAICVKNPRDGFALLTYSEWQMGEILKTFPQEEVDPIFQSVITEGDLKGIKKLVAIRNWASKKLQISDSIVTKGIELLAEQAPKQFFPLFNNGTVTSEQVHTILQQLSNQGSEFSTTNNLIETHPVLTRISEILEKIKSANPNFAAPNYVIGFFAEHPEDEKTLDLLLEKFLVFPKAFIPAEHVSQAFASRSREKFELICDVFNKYSSRSQKYLGIQDVPLNKITNQILGDRVKMLALMDQTDEEDELFLSMMLGDDCEVNLSEMSESQRENLDEKNWATALIAYVSVSEEHRSSKLTDEYKKKVTDQFSEGEYRDKALANMQDIWRDFLSNKNLAVPVKLAIIGDTVRSAGGAGNLKHVESLGNLTEEVRRTLNHDKVAQKTKEELKNLLSLQEARMAREKWSQDDRSLFYGLSLDILQAAPSLYTTFGPVLENLSPKEMKLFMSETFPLYQAQLVTVQTETNDNGDAAYNPRDLVVVREKLKQIIVQLQGNPEERLQLLTKEKSRLVDEIKEKFKSRFNIANVPEEFTKEDLRLVQNSIRYLGNIASRDSTKEAIIAFYLSLGLSHKWEDFRQGKELSPADYISGNSLSELKTILEERAKSYELPVEVAGIPEDKRALFQEILQEEVITSMMGNIRTIDIKLGEVKRNIETLSDPDIYTNPYEKDILALFDKEGKSVGAVLAKTYNQAVGKSTNLDASETAIQDELTRIFAVSNWTPEKVKEIQNTIQPFSLISNVVTKVREERVDENIRELAEQLVPSERIIQIFKRLGEDFSQESGALALAKDISYLENLIVKDEQKLTPEERQEVSAYLESIRAKMKDLETTLAKITEYFEKIKKSAHTLNHQLLKNRLEEIEKIIYSKDSNEMIVSRMTKDLNLVIENMRQCLGCLRKEINNDTNLSFGDYNKFFLMNQGEKEKGSISDEILFFAPLKTTGDTQEMSFVMDRVYGSTSGDVLVSNVLSVFKKYEKIKKEIPEAKLSITIPDTIIRGVGLDESLIKDRLQKAIPELKSMEFLHNLIVTIPPSALSDNYVEFGSGTTRQSGEREFSGLVLR